MIVKTMKKENYSLAVIDRLYAVVPLSGKSYNFFKFSLPNIFKTIY